VRERITDGCERGYPLVQAADAQDLRHWRLRRDETVAASCRVGLVSDSDEGTEPTGVAERQAAQIQQQQPRMAVDGRAALPGHTVGGGEVQFSPHGQDLDLVAAFGRHLVAALGHCRVDLSPLSVMRWANSGPPPAHGLGPKVPSWPGAAPCRR